MKKQFTVCNVETVAFDDQIVTMKAPDATIKLHIHDQLEFDSFKNGDEIELEILGRRKVSKSVAKKPAKKTAAKKTTKKVAPVVVTEA